MFKVKLPANEMTVNPGFNALQVIKGEDGFSPEIVIEKTEEGYILTIINKDDTETIVVKNGVDGKDGSDGKDGQTGPQGPQGPKGDTGKQGPKGETGSIGPAGQKGDKGDKGDRGVDGEDGYTPYIQSNYWFINGKNTGVRAAGTKGDRGEQGIQGIQGIQGPAGPRGERGDAFTISKIYSSVSAMNAGFSSDNVPEGGFVVIETGNIDDVDNAKLFIKTNTKYEFLTDLSGSQGMRGPQGEQGPQGIQGPQGLQGAAGENGKDGYTPVRGIDYWNGADKEEIKSYIDEQLLAVETELEKINEGGLE